MQPRHVILYISLVLSFFLTDVFFLSFKLAIILFTLLKVPCSCTGVPKVFYAYIKLSIIVPLYCITQLDFGSYVTIFNFVGRYGLIEVSNCCCPRTSCEKAQLTILLQAINLDYSITYISRYRKLEHGMNDMKKV